MVDGFTKGSDSDIAGSSIGKAAGLQHAALHVLRALAQMRVAEIDVAPGVDDADHRLAAPVGRVEAALAQPRAMAEGAQVVDAEPAMAAQLFGTFTRCHSVLFARAR